MRLNKLKRRYKMKEKIIEAELVKTPFKKIIGNFISNIGEDISNIGNKEYKISKLQNKINKIKGDKKC